MSAEAWAVLVVAIVGFSMQFGYLKSRVTTYEETVKELKGEMKTLSSALSDLSQNVSQIRDNHLHKLDELLKKHQDFITKNYRRLESLPCEEVGRRIDKLEGRVDGLEEG